MISAIGFAANPPMLIPSVASGAAPELDALRESSDELVRELLAGADSILVIGDAQAVEIGKWLARRTAQADTIEAFVVTADAAHLADELARAENLPTHVGILAMGDGAACRSEKAPGYLDQRSFEFDDSVCSALANADAVSLAQLDVDLAEKLLAAGRVVWPAIGQLVEADGRDWVGELRFRDDPYGVSYFVALWRPRPQLPQDR